MERPRVRVAFGKIDSAEKVHYQLKKGPIKIIGPPKRAFQAPKGTRKAGVPHSKGGGPLLERLGSPTRKAGSPTRKARYPLRTGTLFLGIPCLSTEETERLKSGYGAFSWGRRRLRTAEPAPLEWNDGAFGVRTRRFSSGMTWRKTRNGSGRYLCPLAFSKEPHP